jgi:hypothetical protein
MNTVLIGTWYNQNVKLENKQVGPDILEHAVILSYHQGSFDSV